MILLCHLYTRCLVSWGFHRFPVGCQSESKCLSLSQKVNFCIQMLAFLFTFLKLKYLTRYNKGEKCMLIIYLLVGNGIIKILLCFK